MANIVQRITLQGAEEIRAQLRAIGLAGKDAFDKLADTRAMNERFREADINLKQLTANLKAFGAQASTTAQAGVAFGNAVGSALTRLTLLAGGLGLAFNRVVDSFKRVGEEAETLEQNSAAARLSRQEYEALTNALGANGVGSAEAGRAIDRLTKFQASAVEQSKKYKKAVADLNAQEARGEITYIQKAKALEQLNENMGSAAQIAQRYNVSLTNVDGTMRNARDVLLQLGDGFKNARDQGLAANDALEVFGRGGRKIGQVAGQGSEALKALETRAAALAPSLSDAAQKAVLGMDDAFDQLGQTGKSLQRELVSVFAGQVTGVVSAFTEAIARNRGLLIDLAETVKTTVAPALVNLILYLESPEFGVKLQQAFQLGIDGVKAFSNAIQTLIIPAFLAILSAADAVAAGINKVFGTQLTGGAVIAALAIAKITGLLTVLTTGLNLAYQASLLLYRGLVAFIPLLRAAAVAAGPVGLTIIAISVAVGLLVGLILRTFPQVRDAITNFIANPLEGLRAIGLGIVAFFVSMGQAIVGAFQSVGAALGAVWAAIVNVFTTAFNGIVSAAGAVVSALIAVWQAILQPFVDLWNSIVAIFNAGWEAIKAGAQALWDWIKSSAAAPFQAISDAAKVMYDTVIDYFNKMLEKAKQFLGISKQAGGSTGGGGGDTIQSNAAGGYISGRGTGTSDSILSWLSNGEFVVKAKAVQHYGPQLLDALNNMRLPKFAAGGMVSAAQSIFVPNIPRFAGGGPVTAAGGNAQRPMVLQIGDQVISGLTANGNAVDTITRYAAQKSVRSAGRKPVWFKG